MCARSARASNGSAAGRSGRAPTGAPTPTYYIDPLLVDYFRFTDFESNTLIDLGRLELARGRLVGAEQVFGRARQQVDTLNRLGELAIDHPPAGDPLDYFGRTLVLAEQTGLALPEAHALAGQGRALLHRDDRIGGLAALERALTRYRLLGVPEATDVAGLLAGASARAG
ncbi:MAG TPA: hypothetical protein VHZ97_25170 [Pseudonocardiaceae bacterium]|jgi:hypothetical protein|nr:hypothetical protein [Pseudonocardiaceae bacterium]